MFLFRKSATLLCGFATLQTKHVHMRGIITPPPPIALGTWLAQILRSMETIDPCMRMVWLPPQAW